MSELQQELFEKQLSALARELDYPRTPNVAEAVMMRLSVSARPRVFPRRLAWSLTAILVLFASLMLIPPARAALLEFIQIGVVRIFRAEPTPATPNQPIPATMIPITATPALTSEPLIPILERLAGEMTLQEAQQWVSYPIRLPTYPPDLGLPDRVFVQDAEGDMTILIWIDPEQPERILMTLHMIPPGSWAVDKWNPSDIRETTVDGQRAIWAVGPYPVRFFNNNLDYVRLVDGRVLIWTDESIPTPAAGSGITYRLETELELEEAIRIAESLEPLPEK